MNNLGQRIRERRQEKGLGLRETARLTKVTPSYLCDIEKGSRNPSDELLKKLSETLSLPLRELERLAHESRPITFRPGDRYFELASKLARGEFSKQDLETLYGSMKVLPFHEPWYWIGEPLPKVCG